MEELLETTLEVSDHLVDKHFDKGWDKYHEVAHRKKTNNQSNTTPNRRDRRSRDDNVRDHSLDRAGRRTPTALRPAADGGGARNVPLTGAAAGATVLSASTATTSYPGSRRKQRNQLPSPERDIDHPSFRRDSDKSLRQESETSDRVLREYELEADDPKRHPESVLPAKDLRKLKGIRRDSAMASGYNDGYSQAPYAGESTTRPRSQPPRSRYDDDDDSDYDERSGRRYGRGNGRGYDDDRDYDRIVEETERYRGPVSSGPLVAIDRRESNRSNYDGPYGAGAVTQYGRRSEGALDRQTDTHVSRRPKSRGGRDDRDRSYSRSRSRSRSGSRDGGIRGQLENAFDTSGRGLGVGIAGAVIGGLAGRQFGQKHRERDVVIGALIGGLGANAAENQWRSWKDNKERELKRDEGRWEEKWDGRDYGRSKSNVR